LHNCPREFAKSVSLEAHHEGGRLAQRNLKLEAYWRRLISQFLKSKLSPDAFCKSHRLKRSTFDHWRSEILRRDAREAKVEKLSTTVLPDEKQQLVRLVVEGDQVGAGGIRTENAIIAELLTDKGRLLIYDQSALLSVLRAVRTSCDP
jgi:hypothetical protein